jgi:hypothetical protein
MDLTTNTEPILNKNINKTTYMREYKRKQYKEKGDEIKEKNKAYYYKYKFNMTSEEMSKYDILLPLIGKIKKNMDELKEKNPEFVKEIIKHYI